MAIMSRRKKAVARGWGATDAEREKKFKEEKERMKEKEKKVTKEEHEKRVKKLKEIGILKS